MKFLLLIDNSIKEKSSISLIEKLLNLKKINYYILNIDEFDCTDSKDLSIKLAEYIQKNQFKTVLTFDDLSLIASTAKIYHNFDLFSYHTEDIKKTSNISIISNMINRVFVSSHINTSDSNIFRLINTKKDLTNIKILKPTYYPENLNIIKNKLIDVIIPFYNDPYIIDCLASIEDHKDDYLGRVIIVDDQGGDYKLQEKLKNYIKDKSWINYYQNEENKGFVYSCNKGMDISNNDIILLNTDTSVTKDWLKNILLGAYSEKNIGTVTPLSNNAGYYSLPNPLQQNDDNNYHESSHVVNALSNTLYGIKSNQPIEIHTGHGFCMFIKRETLIDTGLFDYETFGKGYGEENDFSLRAARKGWKNVLIRNTFIYHIKAQSFKLTRDIHNKGKNELLNSMYPELQLKIEEFINRGELNDIRNYFKIIKSNYNNLIENDINNNYFVPEIILINEILNYSNDKIIQLNKNSYFKKFNIQFLVVFFKWINYQYIPSGGRIIYYKAYNFFRFFNLFDWRIRVHYLNKLKSNRLGSKLYYFLKMIKNKIF